jgi:hypothetical protein
MLGKIQPLSRIFSFLVLSVENMKATAVSCPYQGKENLNIMGHLLLYYYLTAGNPGDTLLSLKSDFRLLSSFHLRSL